MDRFIENLRSYYKNGTEGIKIIYISVLCSLVYFILNFTLLKIFGLSIDSFILLSVHSFLPFIWTILTFSFFYYNVLELFFVMVMIYFIEKIFRIYFNGKSFLTFFILGNIVGGFIFLLFSALTKNNSFLAGSILGVYSCLFAIISYNPTMKVTLFPLPIQFPIYVLGLILIGLDIVSLFSANQAISLLASRLGAAAFGYFYMKSFQRGNDFFGRMLSDIFKFKSLFKSRPKQYFNKKKGGKEQNKEHTHTDEEFNINKAERQKQIDKILDKISEKGYDSLTKEEKYFLFNSSK